MARRYGPGMLESPQATCRMIAAALPEGLREDLEAHTNAPAGFAQVLGGRFRRQGEALAKAGEDLALCQQQAGERWEELRDLKQRNRLLAALLLHSFDRHSLSWEAGAIEATLDGVKDKDLMLRRDPASGTLHLRTAPKGDPEPWERL